MKTVFTCRQAGNCHRQLLLMKSQQGYSRAFEPHLPWLTWTTSAAGPTALLLLWGEGNTQRIREWAALQKNGKSWGRPGSWLSSALPPHLLAHGVLYPQRSLGTCELFLLLKWRKSIPPFLLQILNQVLLNSLLNCSLFHKCKKMRYSKLVQSPLVNAGTVRTINSFLIPHSFPKIGVLYRGNK